MQTVLGIDPGVLGGIAWLHSLGGEIHIGADVMPMKGASDIDVAEIFDEFFNVHIDLFCVEQQAGRAGESPRTINTLMKNYGRLLGAAEAKKIPIVIVSPAKWQRAILGKSSKDKSRAMNHVKTRWPSINLFPGKKRNFHDGITDAVCIAEYGYKCLREGTK